MDEAVPAVQQQVNHARYRGQRQGHYESFFLRTNHPTRPLAFWIRYTLFSPRHDPSHALGELWAIFFNGETGQHAAAKREFPLGDCRFEPAAFSVRVGAAQLGPHGLQGAVQGKAHALAWDLKYAGSSPPVFLLPLNLYAGPFPAAKSLVSLPLAHFTGHLAVDGEQITITDWVGSQNHNWGARHTDLYAWGQVAGFDDHPDSFLEVATARLRFGPVWTPPLTLLVLRHAHREYVLTHLIQGIRARGQFDYFTWTFGSKTSAIEIEGQISAPRHAFVGLNYSNPPGGSKQCLNTKIAGCTLQTIEGAI